MWARNDDQKNIATSYNRTAPILPESALSDSNNVWANRYKQQLFDNFKTLSADEFQATIITAAKSKDLVMLKILLIDYQETKDQYDCYNNVVIILTSEERDDIVNLLIDQFRADVNIAAYGYARSGHITLLNQLLDKLCEEGKYVDMISVAKGYVDAENFNAVEKLVATKVVDIDEVRALYRENGLYVREKALKYAGRVIEARDLLLKVKDKCNSVDECSIVKKINHDTFLEVYDNLNFSGDNRAALTSSGYSIFDDASSVTSDIARINTEYKKVFGKN